MTNKKGIYFIFFAIFTCSFSVKAKRNVDNLNLENYFLEFLKGNNVYLNTNKKVKTDKLSYYREFVWEAWCKANKNFNEEKLITLSPLDETRHGSWLLPDSLEQNAIMNYYWGSKGDQPADGYPLFLYLHGSGDKEKEWNGGLSLCKMFNDSPSAYFIPQIPNVSQYRWGQKSKQFAWEKLLRLSFVNGNINPNRVYFFGISEGGYGSQRMASFYADYLAAAGPMAGGEPLRNAPVENCRNIGFSLLTGSLDYGFYRNILTSYAKEVFDSLQSSDSTVYRHRIELIEGMGHGIDYRCTTPWLYTFERNPYPKYVIWEDFDMYGRHRSGFYNIYILKRPKSDDSNRVRYIVDIQNNNINITADFVKYNVTKRDPKWGIELEYSKTYTPAQNGKIVLFLNEELVDLNKEVCVKVNGKDFFKGKIKMRLDNLINSCLVYYDPMRLYPASIEIEF